MKLLHAHLWIWIIAIVTGLWSCAPIGEPKTAAHVQRAAEREGRLVIYGNTALMNSVIAAFEAKYPAIEVELHDLNSNVIVAKVQAEADGERAIADMVWSSAMDAQIKLINDGYAQAYASPHARYMPDGLIWRDQGFGVTAEPIGFAYNRNLIPQSVEPRSHADLLHLLQTQPELFAGRTTIYDVEQSSVAMMHLSSEVQINPQFWTLMEALGQVEPRIDTSGHRMMKQLVEGRMAFVHNVNLSFAQTYFKDHPHLSLVLPEDYHLTVSRVAMITRAAPHPNAARLFLDYLISREGQEQIAAIGVRPARDDVGGGLRVHLEAERPIRVGPGLLANSDQARRVRLLKAWKEAVADAPRAPLDPTKS